MFLLSSNLCIVLDVFLAASIISCRRASFCSISLYLYCPALVSADHPTAMYFGKIAIREFISSLRYLLFRLCQFPNTTFHILQNYALQYTRFLLLQTVDAHSTYLSHQRHIFLVLLIVVHARSVLFKTTVMCSAPFFPLK